MEKWLNIVPQVEARYIPQGKDEDTDPGMAAMGPDKNQLPLDRKVTFFFDYAKGNYHF